MIPHSTRLIAAVLFFGATIAHSQTLNWASLTGSDIVDSHGDPLDSTFVFELGAFDESFIPDETNVSEWSAHWNVFDSTNTLVGGTAEYSYTAEGGGYFTGTRDVQAVTSYSSLFEGMTAYLWIRKGDLTEHFLATSTAKPGNAAWLFPTLDPGCCPNGEVTTWSVSNLGDDVPLWGSQWDQHGGGQSYSPGPYDIQTHMIPEPSGLFLLAMGCGFFVTRRRRSSL